MNMITRALFVIFGALVASAGFVVAAVLARDHYKYTFVEVWLIITSIVITFGVGSIWFIIGLRGAKPKESSPKKADS